MIRILHYIGSLEIGGSQTLVMNLYRNIDREKIQFDFVVDKDNMFFKNEIESMGGRVFTLPNYKIYNDYKYKKAWENFFKDHNEYKIIHSHVRSTASIVLKIAKKFGLVTISHSHNISNGRGVKSLIKKILQFRIRYVADFFMGCSFEANKWLFGKKIAKSSNCIILNNGIDTNKFSFSLKKREKSRKELNIKNEFVIGHVGRFTFQKNHEYLIKIFKQYNISNPNSKLLLIGDGELKKEISERINQLGLSENVIILNNRKDVDYLMNAMDCFVFPSRYEGLGIVAIEAQATGLPCFISNNIPKNVILTDLVKVLNIYDSPELWSNEIQNINISARTDYSKKIIQANFSIQESCKVLCKIYMDLLKK